MRNVGNRNTTVIIAMIHSIQQPKKKKKKNGTDLEIVAGAKGAPDRLEHDDTNRRIGANAVEVCQKECHRAKQQNQATTR